MFAEDLDIAMEGFRLFVEGSDASRADLRRTLAKLPAAHRRLVSGYAWKFEGGNTLAGDRDHVGLLDASKKTITVAAPWNYGREYSILHEIAHLVWVRLLDAGQRGRWRELARSTPMRPADRQGAEELFCMAYAATFTKHPPTTYHHGAWETFVRSL